MLLKSYQQTILNEYGIEFMKENECSPVIAMDHLRKYALKMYLTQPRMNPTFQLYMKMKAYHFVYNTKTNELYRLLSSTPVSMEVITKDGETLVLSQEDMLTCEPRTTSEIKATCGFIAVKKDHSDAHYIQLYDLRSKTVILWTGDYSKLKAIKRSLDPHQTIMDIYEFNKVYNVIVQREYLDFVA